MPAFMVTILTAGRQGHISLNTIPIMFHGGIDSEYQRHGQQDSDDNDDFEYRFLALIFSWFILLSKILNHLQPASNRCQVQCHWNHQATSPTPFFPESLMVQRPAGVHLYLQNLQVFRAAVTTISCHHAQRRLNLR